MNEQDSPLLEAIKLVPYPTDHQAIRVIREEVDRIEWALTEIAPGLARLASGV